MIRLAAKRIKLSKETVEKAREFAKKVYERKLERHDKFVTGGEQEADFLGFLLEFAACQYFEKPEPKLLNEKDLDEFDIELGGKRVDVKHSPRCLVNEDQFRRKEGKIDAFLFGNTQLLDWSTGLMFAQFYGWIDYSEVGKCKLTEFPNGSKAYSVPRRMLRSISTIQEAEA